MEGRLKAKGKAVLSRTHNNRVASNLNQENNTEQKTLQVTGDL